MKSKSNVNRRQLIEQAREFRRAPTPAEATLWQHLRGRKLGGYKFRRQHRINRFVVDFCCLEAELIVELDGPIHQRQIDYDLARTEFLEDMGFRVVRFRNEQVFESIEEVKTAIFEACKAGAA